MKKLLCLALVLGLCLSLGACSGRAGESGAPPGSGAASSAGPLSPGGAVSPASEEQPEIPAATPVPQPGDGLEGGYYNDYLKLLLVIDGRGGCTLSGSRTCSGSYVREGDSLVFTLDGVRETAAVDSDGDILFDGLTGYFLKDWDKWGISQEEAAGQAAPQSASPAPDYAAGGMSYEYGGDGTVRCSDYALELSFICPESLTVAEGRLDGAAAVTDGAGAWVVGRNVTASFAASGLDAEGYLSWYLEDAASADLAALYGGVDGGARIQLLDEEVEGRVASGELRVSCQGRELYGKTIMYTSTYADGTVNYICKSIIAPAEDTATFNAMANGVVNMGAVRLS